MSQKINDKGFVHCVNCTHAKFMQWYENPIIAECDIYHERMVGEAHRICRHFQSSGITDVNQLVIQHFDSYDT